MDVLNLTFRLESASAVLHPLLFNEFRDWFAHRGGEISATDMRQFPVSQPVYAQANLFGTFDGTTVWLHDDAKDIGGAHYTTLDALHLGLHCVQMSLPGETAARLGLAFDREISRREIYEGEGGGNLSQMVAYEAETHGLTLGWVQSVGPRLEKPLTSIGLSLNGLLDLLQDFYAADLTYVEHVLKTNELPLLTEFMQRLDKEGSERQRFGEIRAMIRPVDTQLIEGCFLERLPRGEIIFGVRGPKEAAAGHAAPVGGLNNG